MPKRRDDNETAFDTLQEILRRDDEWHVWRMPFQKSGSIWNGLMCYSLRTIIFAGRTPRWTNARQQWQQEWALMFGRFRN